MTFYQMLFGGELTISTFGEFHASDEVSEQDKVMHAQPETPDGLLLMAADTPAEMGHQRPAGMSITLSGDDEPALRRSWEQLSDGGTVAMPFEHAPRGATFGMCIDRYGTTWMVNATPAS